MYKTMKMKLYLKKHELQILRMLSRAANSLYNVALFNVRQHFFKTNKYLSYYDNDRLCKDNENYKILNSNMAQAIVREVDLSMKSFFGLLKLKRQNKYPEKVSLPRYKKKNSVNTLVINFVRCREDNNKLILELPRSNFIKKISNLLNDEFIRTLKYIPNNKLGLIDKLILKLKIPKLIKDKEIKVVKLIPKYNGAFFEAHFTYIDNLAKEKPKPMNNEFMAIDFGLNNLITAIVSNKSSFIIDGRYIKSINQYYNKHLARLRSINSKTQNNQLSNKMVRIMSKRANQVDYYMYKTARMVINKARDENVGTIILGYNEGFKQNINIGKVNNQSFVSIPLQKLKDRICLLAKEENINIIIQEESYTSKASFFDNDDIPTYSSNDSEHYKFSGKRIKRGLYQTSNGSIINADINGALNILKKSKLDKEVVLSLQCSGVNTPIRLKVV